MSRNFGWIKDTEDKRDLTFKTPLLRKLTPIPEKVDLRPNCAPIRNQGNLGSCTGFGVSFVYELAMQIKGWLDPSELFVYYNARYIGGYDINQDSGAHLRDAIKGAVKWGICPEHMWPYDQSWFNVEPPSKCYREAKKHKALVYERVGPNVRDMQEVLATGYGITLGLYLYSSFFSDRVQTTGVIPTPNINAESFQGGHCVGICGYDNTLKVFTVKNSWGSEWGDFGYGYISYDYLTDERLCQDRWTIRKVDL